MISNIRNLALLITLLLVRRCAFMILKLSQRAMGLLSDTENCGLRMHRECFPCHRLQMKPLVNDPGMHHGTCIAHVPWCMSGSLARSGGGNVPGIPGACVTHNFAYLAWRPLQIDAVRHSQDIIKKLHKQTNISILPLAVFEIMGQECLVSLTPEVGNLSPPSVRHFLSENV